MGPLNGPCGLTITSLTACCTRRADATDTRLVLSLASAVEPLVHTPELVDSARIGGNALEEGLTFKKVSLKWG